MPKDSDILAKSNQPVKVEIAREGFRVLAEGTISSVSKELDSIALFVDTIAQKLGEDIAEPFAEQSVAKDEVAKEVEKVSAADIPSIKSTKSTIENIETLFNTPWGRTPRSLAEIMKALEVNAIPDRVESVNVYLVRLVKRGILRRIEKDKKYQYFRLPE